MSLLLTPACVDEPVLVYVDADGDGYGTVEVSVRENPDGTLPEGFARRGDDCDDHNPTIHPEAQEVCGGIDEDCDGLIDEADDSYIDETPTWYEDGDGDGHGTPNLHVEACLAPRDHVAAGDDCDDTRAWVHPGAVEICDGLDTNCDGELPTGEVDEDGDGWVVCDLDTGDAVEGGGDCDDMNADIYPGAPELADGVVNDCGDSLVDARTDKLGWPLASQLVTDVADLTLLGATRSGNAGWHMAAVLNDDERLMAVTELGADGGHGVVRLASLPADARGEVDLRQSAYLDADFGGSDTDLGSALAVGELLGGDGHPDLVVAAPYGSAVCVVAGPLNELGVHATLTELGPEDGVRCITGHYAMGLDDVTVMRFNDDDYDDLVIGGYGGSFFVFLGTEEGILAESPADADLRVITHVDQRRQISSVARGRGGRLSDELVLAFPFRDSDDASHYRVDAGRIHGLTWETAQSCGVDPNGDGTRLLCDLEAGDASWTLDGELQDQLIGLPMTTGDWDGDGVEELALLARGSTGSYVSPYDEILMFDGLRLNEGGGLHLWNSDADLRLVYTDLGPGFGTSMSLAGDYDGDGRDDLAVGLQYYGSQGEGAVQLFFADTLEQRWGQPQPDLELIGPTDARLGRRVRTMDLDGDGCDDLVLGAPNTDVTGENTDDGAVFGLLGRCI
ncbi:MAG: putative metal-binding motif-containing protein [Alphaproteobacteria bacterium]|nr:putative metal-binding motif-containing protein [Alphaproteobacteria bacterium]